MAIYSESKINSIQLAEEMASELDKGVVHAAVTGMFRDSATEAMFKGANTVYIPEIDMDGLGDYDKDEGYPRGGVSISYRPYTLTMDRGRKFNIDAMDVEESGIPRLLGDKMALFESRKVLPELDAYTLSKLGNHAVTSGQTIGVTTSIKDDVYDIFADMQSQIGDNLDFNQELVCFVDSTVWSALSKSEKFSKMITISDFKRGGINTRVKSIDDVPIIRVPSSRMFTAYDYKDGKSTDQATGGFTPAADAQKIGMLMLPKDACMQVVKHKLSKIYTPNEVRDLDAYQINYRMYYDALILNSLKTGIFAYTYAQ